MYNPFVADSEAEKEDVQLIARALDGKRLALEKLVSRHQRWIYNIAVRMTADFDLAEDITQEILIKMITKLSTFDSSKAAFRTWLYRIVVNYVISMRRKEGPYMIPGGFKAFGKHLDEVPMEALPDEANVAPETRLLIEEAKNGCMSLMLICLSLQQRLVYILGEIFNVSSQEGGEILVMSPANFRKILSRARTKLHGFMREKCGLANPRARCRCSGKVQPHLKTGRIKPGNLKFSRHSSKKVKHVAARKMDAMNRLTDEDLPKLYREHPFYESKDTVSMFKRILTNPKYADIFS